MLLDGGVNHPDELIGLWDSAPFDFGADDPSGELVPYGETP